MSRMKSSSAKKASITLPPDLERDLKKLAKAENRTLSGIIQEATRYYLNIRQYEQLQRSAVLRAAEKGVFDEDDLQAVIESYRKGR